MITEQDEDEMKTMRLFCDSADNTRPDFKLSGRFTGRTLAENGIRLIFAPSRRPFGMAGGAG